MKKASYFGLGCLTSVILFIAFIIIMLVSASQIGESLINNAGKKEAKPGSYLHIALTGHMPEYAPLEDDIFEMNDLSAHTVIQKIRAAKDDPNIEGILLEPRFVSIGAATMHEIDIAIKDFQKSGKQVYAYMSMAFNKDYMLASAADKIFLNPGASAGIMLTGLGGDYVFYKDLMDKLGVEMQVIHAGQYKGAGENYSRTQFSAPFKESLDALFDDIYEEMLKHIEANRGIHITRVRDLYETREQLFINQDKAISLKLVDELAYHDEMLESIGITKKQLIKLKSYSNPIIPEFSNHVAVVYAQGVIVTDAKFYDQTKLTDKRFNKTIDELIKKTSAKAVVIRVNSPGGSALVSDIMWKKIMELKAVKPVVVSMGDVAASGGYFISAPADFIFADPFTITGSIGVVAMVPSFEEASKKMGLTTQKITRGKFASSFNLITKLDAATRMGFEKGIQSTYKEFKTRVADGRKIPFEDVEKIAQGRIWSSEDARENKLVDEIGTLADAIAKAAQLAQVEQFSVNYYPKQQKFLQAILKEKMDIDLPDMMTDVFLSNQPELKALYDEFEQVKNDPIQMRMGIKVQ